MHRCGWTHDDAPEWAHAVYHRLFDIDQKLEHLMSQQDEINADVQTLTNVTTSLQATDQAIQTEITNLEAQVAAGQPVDLTGLRTAVSGLSDVATTLAGIAPASPPADGSDGSQPVDGNGQPTA